MGLSASILRIITIVIYYLLFHIEYFKNIIDKVRPKKHIKDINASKKFRISDLPFNSFILFNNNVEKNKPTYRRIIGPWKITNVDFKYINNLFLIENNELIGVYKFKHPLKIIKIDNNNYDGIKKLVNDIDPLSKVNGKTILNIENKNLINTITYRKYISKKLVHNNNDDENYFIT